MQTKARHIAIALLVSIIAATGTSHGYDGVQIKPPKKYGPTQSGAISEAFLDKKREFFVFKLLTPIDYASGCSEPVTAHVEYLAYPFHGISEYLEAKWNVLTVDRGAPGTLVVFTIPLQKCSYYETVSVADNAPAYLVENLTVYFASVTTRQQWVEIIEREAANKARIAREELKKKGGGDIPLKAR